MIFVPQSNVCYLYPVSWLHFCEGSLCLYNTSLVFLFIVKSGRVPIQVFQIKLWMEHVFETNMEHGSYIVVLPEVNYFSSCLSINDLNQIKVTLGQIQNNNIYNNINSQLNSKKSAITAARHCQLATNIRLVLITLHGIIWCVKVGAFNLKIGISDHNHYKEGLLKLSVNNFYVKNL